LSPRIAATYASISWEVSISYGIDGIFRLFGDDYLNVKWTQSYDDQIDSELSSLEPSFIMVNWERRSEEGFAYELNYTYAGQDFYLVCNDSSGFRDRNLLPGNPPFHNKTIMVKYTHTFIL